MRIQIALAAMFVSGALYADSAAPDLQTKSGRTYQRCQVIKVGPDGITFRHTGGMARVLYSDMNRAAQQEFGYDPQKERAYMKQVEEQRAKKRELALKQAQERAKAYEEARQRALENQTLLALQQSAMIQTALAQQQQVNGVSVIGGVGMAPFSNYGGYAFNGAPYANRHNRSSVGTNYGSQSLFNHYGALVNYQGPVQQGYRHHGVVRPMGGGWSAPSCPPVRSVNSVGGGR